MHRFLRLRRAAFGMGVGVIFLALAGWLGWVLDIASLRSLSPEWASMKPNTSIGLFVCGSLLILSVSGKQRSFSLGVVIVASLFLFLLGGATLLQYFTHWDFGIDHRLFSSEVLLLKSPYPGRMSPAACFCFILSGIAFFVGRPTKTKEWIAILQAVASALIVIGAFSVIGYLVDVVFGYHGWAYSGMAGHTALAFIFLGIGLFFKASSEGALTWFLDLRTTLGFGAGVVLMILAVNVAHHFAAKMQKMATSVEHRQNVLREIQQLGAELSDMESSQRGFIITGNETMLEKRPENRERAGQKFRLLEEETADNPVQQQYLRELDELIRQKNTWDEQAITERKEKGFPAASRMVAIGTGMDLWQKIRLQFGKMRNEEYRLMAADQKEVTEASDLTFLLLPLGAFLSLTLISGGIFFLNSGMEEQHLAEERLRISLVEGRRTEEVVREREKQLSAITANLPGLVAQLDENLRYRFANAAYEKWFGIAPQDLLGRKMGEVVGKEAYYKAERHAKLALSGQRVDFENQVTTRNGENLTLLVTFIPSVEKDGSVTGLFVVAMDITKLKQAEAEILKLNASLEQRVADRTAELEMANKELEAFSYSVSHDLRAPLRTVDGFSQAVMEDYGRTLPEEAMRYLKLVRGGAQKMGHLIDDLLTFSRLSRLPLNRDEITMTRLIEECLSELEVPQQKKLRKLQVEVGPMPKGYGDQTLLKQVWLNLISNALKYSRKSDAAQIEIGCDVRSGEQVYFIKDNGTGFDMRYASKLFGVFQRLHRAEEYEGTGVGLAIVQRVIHRHGGRVWADSKPGEGASFYFTLGEKNI